MNFTTCLCNARRSFGVASAICRRTAWQASFTSSKSGSNKTSRIKSIASRLCIRARISTNNRFCCGLAFSNCRRNSPIISPPALAMMLAARSFVSMSSESSNGNTNGTTPREPMASNASRTYRVRSWLESLSASPSALTMTTSFGANSPSTIAAAHRRIPSGLCNIPQIRLIVLSIMPAIIANRRQTCNKSDIPVLFRRSREK